MSISDAKEWVGIIGAPALTIIIMLGVMYGSVIPVLKENTRAQDKNAAATNALAEAIKLLPNVEMQKTMVEHLGESHSEHTLILGNMDLQHQRTLAALSRIERFVTPSVPNPGQTGE